MLEEWSYVVVAVGVAVSACPWGLVVSRVDVPLLGRADVPLRGHAYVPLHGHVDVPLHGRGLQARREQRCRLLLARPPPKLVKLYTV